MNHRTARGGMTLVELTISMIIVALLTAGAIYALRSARARVRTATTVANLGLTARDFLAFAAEHDMIMPNVGLPAAPIVARWYSVGAMQGQPPLSADVLASLYWTQTASWPRYFTWWRGSTPDHWYSAAGPTAPEQDPRQGAPIAPPFDSDLYYSPTMITKPSLWTWPASAMTGWAALAPMYEVVSLAKVRRPSGKGMLTYNKAEALGSICVAFCDGGASERNPADAGPTAQPPNYPPNIRGKAVLHTIDGYLGADF